MRVTLSCLVLLACGGSSGNARAPHSSATVSACAPADAATRRTPATLVLTIRTEPALTADADAAVRIEGGEAYRTDITVSAIGGSRLELARGTYDVRIALKGYESVAARALLTGGCNAEMVATLRRR